MKNNILSMSAVLFICLLIGCNVNAYAKSIQISDLQINNIGQGWETPQKNLSVSGNPITIANKQFIHGIGTHAPSFCKIKLHGTATRFQASVGIDAESSQKGSVEFIVYLDDKIAYRSGIIKGSTTAKKIDLNLKGYKQMSLEVTDADDGNSSDHANWANAIIAYNGSKPEILSNIIQFPPVTDAPGAPANETAILNISPDSKKLQLNYDGYNILESSFSNPAKITTTTIGDKALQQNIKLSFPQQTTVKAIIHASSEAIAAETKGAAQKNFKLVRTSHGLSNNLRNNAIYDRNCDWMIEAPQDSIIKSSRNSDGATKFELTFTAKNAELIFRPRYYQKHKNIHHFQPWTYSIRKDSIAGWCSWWAYMRNCKQSDVDAVMKVWNEKHLADFGYRFIQLDDVFQGGQDANRKIPDMRIKNYIGGRPETWLQWKRDIFPGGMYGYTNSVTIAGFDPAIWMGCFFTDKEIADAHPDWFVQDKDGKPFVGNWVTYVVDSTNPQAADALIRPTFRGLKNAGFKYVKIDQLRHMIYDNLNHNHQYLSKANKRPDDIFRAYLRIAREELGDDCFILSCWGVLPESIGLADACRIGGDGYGPVTMQQYNSWNGIVWRNDPDHCDVSPRKAAQGVGNVLKTKQIKAASNDSIIRPALASIAGCMLMLSDKPDVYADDNNLVGAKRSAPVLFSVPGQLYDFDSKKTDIVKTTDRASVKGGSGVSSIDGDQFGYVCPFWLNEFNKPFENWNVLHRLNWTDKDIAKPTIVKFVDLGLDPTKEYLVHEFWTDKTLGVLKNQINLGSLEPMGLQSLAIRKKLNHPQLISTNRHLSQGAAEIEMMQWQNNSLTGRSKVIANDPYTLTLYAPQGYKLTSATINNKKAQIEQKGNILKVSYLPTQTDSVSWQINFKFTSPTKSGQRKRPDQN